MHPHERASRRQLRQLLPHLVRLKQGAQTVEDLQSMGDIAPVRKRSSPRFHLPDGSAEAARWASSTFLLPHPSVLSPGHRFAFPLAPRRLHLGAPTWASPSSLLSQASIRSCAFSFLTHHYSFSYFVSVRNKIPALPGVMISEMSQSGSLQIVRFYRQAGCSTNDNRPLLSRFRTMPLGIHEIVVRSLFIEFQA